MGAISCAPLPRVLDRRVREIDGLRGLAILLVVVYHYVKCSVVAKGVWFSLGLAPLRLTWSGVDLFFVLSGYLIGGILLDAKTAASYFRTFYWRRWYRIIPLYSAWVVLFSAGLAAAPATLDGMFNVHIPAWSYLLFLQNVLIAKNGTFGAQWMFITWSLAVEEQFYLILPAVIRTLTVKNLQRAVIGAIVCAPLIRVLVLLIDHNRLATQMLLPCRADCLGLGVLLALAVRHHLTWLEKRRRSFYWLLAILFVGNAVIACEKTGILLATVGYTWLAFFYATLVLLVVVKPGPAEIAIFGNRILVWLGTISYALYLCHEGFRGVLFVQVFGRPAEIADWPTVGISVIALGASLGFSTLSWKYLERPFVTRARRLFRYEPVEAPIAAVAASAAG